MDIPIARQSAGAGDYVEGELKMSDLISRKVLDLWNRYKPTIAVDAIEYDRELNELLGTNLAEVGTDCISRQAAIDALKELTANGTNKGMVFGKDAVHRIEMLPSAQPDTYWKEQCQSYEQTINKLRESLSTQPEIIRCKDCKHWIPYEWMFSEVWQSKNIADYPEDEIGCDCCDMAMKANDFCSRVERRTE